MRFSHERTHQPCLSDMPPRPKILNLLAGIFVRGATPDKQIKYGPLAQWLEQATHNRTVIGSNPVGATNSLSHIKISAVELLLRAHLYACLVRISGERGAKLQAGPVIRKGVKAGAARNCSRVTKTALSGDIRHTTGKGTNQTD